jgi:polysaccharide export outer membrane protein
MFNKRFLVCAFALLAAGACAQGPGLQTGQTHANIELLDADRLPVPSGFDTSDATRPYLIGPFDRLKIDVFGVPELANAEIQADASGRISVPLAGEIEAAGKSPGEVAAVIEDRLRRYIRQPEVAVNLLETVSQVVTVDGEVRKPGLYPVLGQMTLMRAVARAEGLSEMAQPTDVVIFRSVEGQKYAALYDLRAIRRGVYEDPEVFANDVVVVGHSAKRQLFKDTLALVPALLSPLIYLVR